jgi:hypothetical protein
MADGTGMAPRFTDRVASVTSGASYLVDGGAAAKRYADVLARSSDAE